MRRALKKARWLMLLAPLVLAACKDDPAPGEDPPPRAACLEPAPTLMPPASGQLPCELLPPGFPG